MTVEDIFKLSENIDLPDKNTLPELKQLVEEYPYFQTARLLYLINLFNVNDLNAQAELRKTAFYACDRRKLFLLLKRDQLPSLSNPVQPEKENSESGANDTFSLIDFFLSSKNVPEEDSVPLKRKEKKETLVSQDYISLLLTNNKQGSSGPEIPLQHQDIIDEFLKEDKIASFKIELKTEGSEEQAEKPATEGPSLETPPEGSFFSETLAKIYLKQKKYDKALAIIRKLNLLYPEKNIYFADQIRFLEKLLVNIKK